jgi:tetratricopeptide (TPR) repeat protein
MDLAERLEANEYLAPATSRLAAAHGMRGEEGDLDLALELGERTESIWIPGTRTVDLAEHHHHMVNLNYWTGRYDQVLEHARKGAELSTTDPGSIEILLRGHGTEALALAALGRYEQAFAKWDTTIALCRELGRLTRVPLNYSTMALRDIFDLAESKRRSEEALEQTGWAGFLMPRLNSLVDVVVADLESGDVGSAEAAWPSTWEEVLQGKGWERWLLYGKMEMIRAEIALRKGDLDMAADWASNAIASAVRTRRYKYESASRALLGQVLLANGRGEEAIREIRTAVSMADELGSPPGRWQSRAALGRALYATGDDDGAASTYREAAEIIRAMADSLSAEHQKSFMAAPQVEEVRKAAG